MAVLNKKAGKGPKVALLSGNISMMKELISQGAITAAVITRPDYIPGKEKLPKDIESAFDERYLLVTPENVKRVAAENPTVFNR